MPPAPNGLPGDLPDLRQLVDAALEKLLVGPQVGRLIGARGTRIEDQRHRQDRGGGRETNDMTRRFSFFPRLSTPSPALSKQPVGGVAQPNPAVGFGGRNPCFFAPVLAPADSIYLKQTTHT